MTVWDKIYKDYRKGGDAWATLAENLIPQFLTFVAKTDFKNKKAFDIGCGTGKYLAFLKKLGFEVAGIDSSETAIAITKENLGQQNDIICANMFEYPVINSVYDFIFSISTIHHGTKRQIKKLLDEIYDTLLSEGKIFITLPDFENTKKWNTFKDHKDLGEGTLAPLIGPEQGLPHSFYNEQEIREIFLKYKNLSLELDNIGRWIITGQK